MPNLAFSPTSLEKIYALVRKIFFSSAGVKICLLMAS